MCERSSRIGASYRLTRSIGSPAASATCSVDWPARIRAGQSTEQVAEAAGLPIDRVSRYEAPILLERSHMAETAQAVSVRRVTDSVNTPLGVLVQARLDEHNVAPESLVWDSYRRDDGRWQVTLGYEAGGRARTR